MIPYSKQHIFDIDIRNVNKVLKSNFLTQGPIIDKFEKKLASKCKSKYAVALNSGTSALHIACLALGLNKKDYLWTVPISFVASANCALYCGAKIDFVDIENQTFNIDIEQLKKKLFFAKKKNKLPSILIPVHLGGNPCKMKEIYHLSRKYKFKVVEDASHALGSFYNNYPIGNCKYSEATIFSFHPVKTITSAEGGAVLTNNNRLREKISILREHGITKDPKKFKTKKPGNWFYEQQYLGFNYRLSDVHAALGLSQINNINKFIKKRNKIAEKYEKELASENIGIQKIENNSYSSRHLFIIRINKKIHKKFFNFMRNKGYYVNIHYIPIYRHPFYKKILKIKKSNFPNSENYYSEAISIPIFYNLGKKQQLKIINNIKKFLKINEK